MMMKNTRWIAGSLGLCGVLLLGGCAAPGAYGDYGYGSPYGGYSQPPYGSATVVAPAPVYIQGGYGGYYDQPAYYGRPGYVVQPGYVARPGYGGYRGYRGGDTPRPNNGGYRGGGQGRPDQGFRPGNGPGFQPGAGGRPSRGNPSPQQLAPNLYPAQTPPARGAIGASGGP